MPTFDVVSKVDMQEVDNTVTNTLKEIATRYDFRNMKTEVKLDKKQKLIHVVAADKMKMQAVREMMIAKAIKRGLDIKCFKFEDPTPTSDAALKRDIRIREGIEQDLAKKIVKMIKETKMKVQASIQGDEVRVSAKKIDDLQSVISLLEGADLDVPLQFVNMKS
jgi:uncharacterized protein YajQ (UPF0234 family)